jgi:hypothetical protein
MKQPRKRRKHDWSRFPFKDEGAFQVAAAIQLRRECPPDVVWFHVPNGEERHVAVAVKLKEMGVRPGVADVIMFGRGVALAIELKTPDGELSENQEGFRDAWVRAGGRHEIARNLGEFRAIWWAAFVAPGLQLSRVEIAPVIEAGKICVGFEGAY